MYRLPFPLESISSPYGPRSLAGGTFHEGIDWPLAMNTPLPALADGVVVAVGESKKFGKYIVVKADDGSGYYRWHAANAVLVAQGDRVRSGQVIARSGKSGFWSTGPHGHLQCTHTLNPDTFFNPLAILSAATGVSTDSTTFDNEEDDMYTDLDRARDNLTHDAVARIELKLYTLQQTATKAQAAGDVAVWALTAEGVGVREQIATLTNLVATIKGGGLTEQQLREALGASISISAEAVANRIAPDLAELVDDILAALPQSDATPAQIAAELAKRLAE